MDIPIFPGAVDVDEIVKGLYIGNIMVTKDIKFLSTHGIKSVLSVTNSPVFLDPKKFEHLQFKISDFPYQDIITFFDVCNTFIDASLKRGVGVLVHCDAGISRSASFVIAYLMKLFGKSFEQTYGYVKTKRHRIDPNIGFVYQLKLYDKMNCELRGGSQAHRLFNNFVFIDGKNQDISFDTERYVKFINKQYKKERKEFGK
jgi:hypothetical protein